MCAICDHFPCVPTCPNFSGQYAGFGAPRGICAVCGKLLQTNSKYVRKRETLICESCIKNDIEDGN